MRRLIHHAVAVAIACNEDVRTGVGLRQVPALDAEQHAAEPALPKEDFMTKATLNVLGVALPR
eukprot:9282960-Lingulodinium_polyedra.AAC.1